MIAQPETIIEAIRVTNANIDRGRYIGQTRPGNEYPTKKQAPVLDRVVDHEKKILRELKIRLKEAA